MVHPAAALVSYFMGTPLGLSDVLVKGDVLFLVVVLLATTWDWTVPAILLTPRSRAGEELLSYIAFIVLVLALLFYTLIHGGLIPTRLLGAAPIANPDGVVLLRGMSFVGGMTLGGVQYYRLRRRGRI
ncbi:MAG: hypothetical protein ACK4RK_20075 [Gemmataceae bacterium]